MGVDYIPVGDTGAKLDTFKVPTTAVPDGAHRESVVITSPTNPNGIADVINTVPAADAFGQVVRVAGTVDELRSTVKTAKATGSAVGPTLLATPAAGKAIRLWWYSLQASPANGAKVVAGIRFGTGGDDIHTYDLSQYGGIVAHSFRAGSSYVQGAVDVPIYINQDAAQVVRANIDYEEVTP